MPTPVVPPGTFPVSQLDQKIHWVLSDGCIYRIDALPAEACLSVIDYVLANAKMLRIEWSISKREPYNETQRPRRWMLDRPAIRAILRQLVRKEDEVNATQEN